MNEQRCVSCVHWRREWVWRAGEGKINKRFGECSSEDLHRAFDGVNEDAGLFKLAVQIPTAKPNEDFGCIFWKEKKDEEKSSA